MENSTQTAIALMNTLASTSSISFSEGNDLWQPVPAWALFMLDLGWHWSDLPKSTRRVSLITTPCESCAAALVILGAMIRRLSIDGANDLESHFRRIESFVRERNQEAILKLDGKRGRYVVDGELEPGMIWVRELNSSRATRQTITFATAGRWRIDGAPPVQIHQGNALPGRFIYSALSANGCSPIKENLSRTDSAICLAGRAIGLAGTLQAYRKLRFKVADSDFDTASLLSVHPWTPDIVSRVSFFNTRTGQLDRETCTPSLVVADGNAAMSKILDQDKFRESDVIAVIPRTLDRSSLEDVGNRMSGLLQWYYPDKSISPLRNLPAGITSVTLSRKTS